MDSATKHQLLSEIRQQWEEGRGGKILQQLLEIAFHQAGYKLLEERLSEGIDFDVELREAPHHRYSFEARTTVNAHVPVKEEDLRQMDQRMRDGYEAGVAALRIAAGCNWIFVERAWLQAPSVRVSLGTSERWRELSESINHHFDSVLEELGPIARDRGLAGLAPYIRKAHL